MALFYLSPSLSYKTSYVVPVEKHTDIHRERIEKLSHLQGTKDINDLNFTEKGRKLQNFIERPETLTTPQSPQGLPGH